MINNSNLHTTIKAALSAGKVIMDIYGEEDFQVVHKQDETSLTLADEQANNVIINFLTLTGSPIISGP